jgi:hypothetical protein
VSIEEGSRNRLGKTRAYNWLESSSSGEKMFAAVEDCREVQVVHIGLIFSRDLDEFVGSKHTIPWGEPSSDYCFQD